MAFSSFFGKKKEEPVQEKPKPKIPLQVEINDVPAPGAGAAVAPMTPAAGGGQWDDLCQIEPAAPAPVAAAPPPPEPKLSIVLSGRYDLKTLLITLVENGGSDLHLSVGLTPAFRVDGHLIYAEGSVLTEDHALELVLGIMDDRQRNDYETRGNCDLAYALPGVARYRCNVFRQLRGAGAVFRQIPEKIPTLEQLGFPMHVMDRISTLRNGLVVVTGPTGSGKSTTLAGIINKLNESRDAHIITIEDPIEFTHQSKRCLVDHREVGADAISFADAARASLREDPDILLLGEMRDLDTIYNAIKAAETGTLVFGTLHTNSASKTVDRIIDAFPANEQPQIRSMLSQSLKVVVAQSLLRKKTGGRVAAYEIMLVNRGISNLLRTGETTQLENVLLTGTSEGMQPLDLALVKLLDEGLVEPAEVKEKANNPDFFAQRGYRL